MIKKAQSNINYFKIIVIILVIAIIVFFLSFFLFSGKKANQSSQSSENNIENCDTNSNSDNCYYNLAVSKHQGDLCGKIKDSDLKNRCEQESLIMAFPPGEGLP